MHKPSKPTTRSVARLTAVFAAGLLVALSGCSRDDGASAASGKTAGGAKGPAAKGGGMPAMPVRVQRMALERVPIVIEAVGQAQGSREVEVRARVNGILEKRLFNEGAPVQAGAVLFRIDPAPYELAVRQARALLMQEQARAEQARREAERLKGLAEQRAISQKEFQDAASAAQLAAAGVAAAEARLAEAQLNLSYTTVRAPISGITGSAARSEGSLVNAGTESSLLTTLTQIDPIWIQFALAQADYERIRGAERKAVVKLLNDDGSVAADGGRIIFRATAVDPKLSTVPLRAEFRNPKARWLPGQFVRVHVNAGEQEAFLVPQAAVMQTEQGKMVWVVGADGTASPRPVQTGGWIGDRWVITDGLKPGEQVIVDNLMKLRPGAPVQPHEGGPPPGAGGAPPAAGKAQTAATKK